MSTQPNFKFVFVPFLLIFCIIISAHAQPYSWQQTNGPEGGIIQAMVFDHTGNIYVGTWWGGVFVSSNNGEKWRPVLKGLKSLSIFALTVTQDNTILVGTDGAGVLRLPNNQDEWISSTMGAQFILSLVVHQSGRVIAGSNGNGVYVSSDNGQNWTVSNTGLGSNLYVSNLGCDSSGTLYAGTSSGLYRSTDAGSSWALTSLADAWVNDITIGNAGEILIAGRQNSNYSGGVFRSIDAGQTWSFISGLGTSSIYLTTSGLSFSGTSSGLSGGIYKSSNFGLTWTKTFSVPSSLSFGVIGGNAVGDVFAGSGGSGIFRSTDQGSTWSSQTTGLVATYVNGLGRTTDGIVYAGTSGRGVFKTTDDGELWTACNTGLSDFTILSLSVHPDGYPLISTNQGVFILKDEQEGWIHSLNTPYKSVNSVDVDHEGNIYAGAWGTVHYSTDGGTTWKSTTSGLPNESVYSIMRTSQPGVLLLGSQEGAYKSTDNGVNWQPSGFSGMAINALVQTSSGDVLAGGANGVSKSTNQGVTWLPSLSNGMGPVRSMVTDTNGHIFAIAVHAVYRSTDNGTSWLMHGSALNERILRSGVVGKSGDLMVGTIGTGVYRYKNAAPISVVEMNSPDSFVLPSNYPNPFNSSTTVEFLLPGRMFVKLEVFDTQGRKVSTLIDGELAQGMHKTQWQAEGVSSGVYYCVLKAGGVLKTIKIVMVK